MTSSAGQGKRYVVLALLAALPPAYWSFERSGSLPIVARDRALLLGVGIVLVVLASAARAWRGAHGRARFAGVAAHVVAAAVTVGFAATARAHYELPPSSPSMKLGVPLVTAKLTDDTGAKVDLSGLRDKPTLVVWFRGSWCPYCKHQLKKLAKELPSYGDRVRVVGVTWDPYEQLADLRKELALPFPLFSDPDGALMSRCELMHCVAVLDAGGIVRWGVISGNWRTDIPESALLQRAFESR